MSTTETQEMEMATKPRPEHEWLKKLVGEWKTETDMIMPDGSQAKSTGTESVRMMGDLWAIGEGRAQMPDGDTMEYLSGMGYDVTFNEYRGFWTASASSHLWKYICTMSPDGRKLTMNCEGPDMMSDKPGATAQYRDEIEIIDENHRTLTSSGQGPDGQWMQFMKCHYTRV